MNSSTANPAQQTGLQNVPIFAVLALILLAILGRFLPWLVPQLGNFTPVAAIALFAGCYLKNQKIALWVPLVAMLVSDAIIGFHSLIPVVYSCLAMTVYFGMLLQKQTTGVRVLGFALASSLMFFITTNFAVWLTSNMYPMTASGLQACFVAAIPFWRNELLGTLCYSAALFGGYALLKARYSNTAAA
jgi:hypothetical protein